MTLLTIEIILFFLYYIVSGDVYMKFSDIFNNYINLIKCTSKDISNISNLSESIISRYKNGSRIPNYENALKLSKALSTLSNNKYKELDILGEFYNSTNMFNIDFNIVIDNLNILIDKLNINVNNLSKFLNYDASYLSRIRNKTRIPSDKDIFINSFIDYTLKRYNNDILKELIKNDINYDNIKNWLLTNKIKEDNDMNYFLNELDEFNLNDFIKNINFDSLQLPNVPFYRAKTKRYYGIEGMKYAELDFLKATALSKSKEDIFMCSDMPLDNVEKDIEFKKRGMYILAVTLQKGLRLNIIHNLERPFDEIMNALKNWLPLYMTGQVNSYYFKNLKNTVYHHINYTSGSVILTGECINNNIDKCKYYVSTNNKDLEYYKEKRDMLLKEATSLMDIYKEEDIDNFNTFILKDKDIKCDRKRLYSTLPIFTIEDKLLLKILKRNKINKDNIDKIMKYKKEEEINTLKILKTNKINDIIYKLNKNDFKKDIYLSLENIFCNLKIKYNYEEYLAHYDNTLSYKNNNYIISINKHKTFNNLNIFILKDNYAHLAKNGNQIIHFVVKEPKLMNAIENLNYLLKK